ncbi:MAG: peptidylprolyl isomerase, partial [Myxococcota bacterium]
MLSQMRDHRKNRVLQIIVYSMFAIIIIVFAISFGPGSWGQGGGLSSRTHAANVNGTVITGVELERIYGTYAENYRQQTGQALTSEQAQALGIRKQILDALIDKALVVQEAPSLGIQVSDSEVSQALRENPSFHTNGNFDQDLFERYCRNVLGTSTGRFFELVREDLLYERVISAVRSSVNVSPGELWEKFVEENDKVNLEYVRFSPTDYRGEIEPTDDQIDEVLAEREDEVASFYERNAFRYEQPERVRARHVLISAGPEVSEEERAAARVKADEILAQAREGADFAELAREHSDDPGSAQQGGDLDWFPRGQMVPAFEEVAFSLEPGEISDVVETPFGYHIILVEDHQEAQKQPLEEVSREIAADILRGEMAEEVARREAESLLEEAVEKGSLSAVAGLKREDEAETSELEVDGLELEGAEG